MGDPLGLTMGVALMGTLISAILYGITVTQTYLYFQRFPKDEILIKIMVVALWILDTLHLSLISHSMYYYLVLNFNNNAALAQTVWSFNLEVSVNGLIGLIVECFFARRLLRLSGGSRIGWVLTSVVGFLSLIHFGLGIFFTDRLYAISFFAGLPALTWITKVGLGSAAACDMLIAVSLCWYLYSARTGYRKTDSLIVTLMLYTLNCGLLTGVCAAMVIIMFAVFPNTLFFMAFFWVLGKLYCNSCVAMLNSRQSLRGKLGYVVSDQPSKITIPRARRDSFRSSGRGDTAFDLIYARPASPQPALTVRVDTTTETMREYGGGPGSGRAVREKSSTLSSQNQDQREDFPVTASPSSTVPLMSNGLPGDPWTRSNYSVSYA